MPSKRRTKAKLEKNQSQAKFSDCYWNPKIKASAPRMWTEVDGTCMMLPMFMRMGFRSSQYFHIHEGRPAPTTPQKPSCEIGQMPAGPTLTLCQSCAKYGGCVLE